MGPASDLFVSFESLVLFDVISQSLFNEELSKVVEDIEGFGGDTDWLIDLPDVEDLMSLYSIANATVLPSESQVLPLESPSLQTLSNPILVVAGHGEERQRSEHNDNWAS